MKRYNQDQFGDMKEHVHGKYVLYEDRWLPSDVEMMEDFKELISECKSLIDGASIIVELFVPKSPAQIKWKEDWLKKSREILGG